jgi:hypothetical protein
VVFALVHAQKPRMPEYPDRVWNLYYLDST